jgi:Lrp/AsnC family transcriptional regulator, cysteine-sensing transcriptional activator
MLDELDLRLLAHLQQNCVPSLGTLADELGSSKSVIGRRMQRLLDEGIIKSRVAVIDQDKVGLGITVFAHVKMEAHDPGSLEGFAKKMFAFPQVLECHTMMGDFDFLLKIVVPSIADYKEFFWESLSGAEGVRGVSSNICLVSSYATTELPLSCLAPKTGKA